MKIVIPNINLKKFYRVSAFQNVESTAINLSEKTLKSYLRFRDQLFGGYIKAESYAIFFDILREKVLTKTITEQELSQLSGKPFNPITIINVFKSKNQTISNTSAKRLLSLLLKLNLIDEITVIKKLDISDETKHDEELINNYLLNRKGFISIGELKHKFRDHQRKHLLNEYLIELWINKKIDIQGVDVPRTLCNKYDYKNIPPEEVKEYKSIEIYRKRETGELRVKISLNDDYKLYPKGE